MIVNLKVNFILGFVALLFTFLFSFVNNTWQTSLLRALLGFLLFFILGFILRFIPQQTKAKKQEYLNSQPLNNAVLNEEAGERKTEEKELESEPSFQAITLESLHILGSASETKK
jgi:vacuolar-type H+-ATPase subunit I/STV1